MFSMIFLALLAFYLALFVVIYKQAERWMTRIFLWLLLASPVILIAWDIQVGEYKFQQLCKKEAGLKIYVQNPEPAKIIRLENDSVGSAKVYLKKYKSLKGVETIDYKNDMVYNPMAYALYELNEDSKEPTRTPLDAVEAGKVVRQGDSKADYTIKTVESHLPIRMWKYTSILTRKDGVLVATSTYITYSWSVRENTLFGVPFNSVMCGKPLEDDIVKVIAK